MQGWKKIVRKGENAGNNFLLFHNVSKSLLLKAQDNVVNGNSMLQPDGKFTLTLSQTSPGFYLSSVQVLKTLWEKEKLLVMRNFSFAHCFRLF